LISRNSKATSIAAAATGPWRGRNTAAVVMAIIQAFGFTAWNATASGRVIGRIAALPETAPAPARRQAIHIR